MNQLKLNLELVNSLEQEYRGFRIILYQSFPKKMTDRYKGIGNALYWQTTETRTYWESVIHKNGNQHSGKTIVGDAWTKDEAMLRTQAWIDIWVFNEREKHKYVR